MNYLHSPLGDNTDEEEGSFLSDFVIALVAFECLMCAGYLIANTLFG